MKPTINKVVIDKVNKKMKFFMIHFWFSKILFAYSDMIRNTLYWQVTSSSLIGATIGAHLGYLSFWLIFVQTKAPLEFGDIL